MKTLRICSSEFLPPITERDSEYIYFVYDKMTMYIGQNTYTDPFCIVDTMPDKPVAGMLYITFDGFLKSYINDGIVDVAEVEDIAQLDYLKTAGSVYFMKADYRYLDLQTKTLILPYQNGTFQLSVNLMDDIMIDEDTIITYNPDNQRFEISGTIYNDGSSLPNITGYKGQDTSTVRTTVDGKSISSDIKISDSADNIVKVFGNGVYVNVSDRVSAEKFNTLLNSYGQYKAIIDQYIEDLKNSIAEAGDSVSGASIRDKIIDALKDYEPTIMDMINNYDEMYDALLEVQDLATTYADEKLDAAKKEITDYLDDITEAWETFPFDRNEDADNSGLTNTEYDVLAEIVAAAQMQIMTLRTLENTQTGTDSEGSTEGDGSEDSGETGGGTDTETGGTTEGETENDETNPETGGGSDEST